MNNPKTICNSSHSLVLFIVLISTISQAIAKNSENSIVNNTSAVQGGWQKPEQILKITQDRLVVDFNKYLESSENYEELVNNNCYIFPEGDLFSYVYPVLAYVNLAIKDSGQKENSILQAQKLIDLAIFYVSKRVRPPGGRLENLSNYRNQAVYLGQLNLALGAYYMISDDSRYNRLHQRLSDIFHEAMLTSNGRSLNSFPDASWPFDTIPALVSLHLYDRKTSSQRSKMIIEKHLEWVVNRASHPQYKLPYSRINNITGQGRELPRGCDLSFRICLLAHINRKYAKQLYEDYTKTYWIDTGIFAGFSEWPNGIDRFEDIDSGPVFMGVGLGATGMGLGAAIAVEDDQRIKRLSNQMQVSSAFIRPLLVKFYSDAQNTNNQMIPISNDYYSGFLFGDAMLFYCVTWQKWNE